MFLGVCVCVCTFGEGTALQWTCLENPRDGGTWWAAICGVAQRRTRLTWLSSSSSVYAHCVFVSGGLVLCPPRYFEVLGWCIILCSKCSCEESLITLYSAFYSYQSLSLGKFLKSYEMHIRERSTACPFPTEPPLKKIGFQLGWSQIFDCFRWSRLGSSGGGWNGRGRVWRSSQPPLLPVGLVES